MDEQQIDKIDDLKQWGYDLTTRAKRLRDAFTDKLVGDKFGEATTRWRKLDDWIKRGVGSPCPLILIELPASIVTFYEGKAALAEGQGGSGDRRSRLR